MEDAIQGLIETAYSAAFDDRLWSDFAWRTTQLMGGTCGTLYVVESNGHIRQQVILHDNVGAIERYLDERICQIDPQISHVAQLRQPGVYCDTDHVDRDHGDTREYFAWQASIGKLQHYATAATRLAGGSLLAGLSVHRHVHEGVTPDLSRRVMEHLLPHLTHAMALSFCHNEKLTAAYWDGLLTRRSEACLLLAEDGRVLRTTPAMEALLAQGDGLGCVHGRLIANSAANAARLDALVGSLKTENMTTDTCRLDRPSGKAPYVLTGYPLVRRARLLAPVEAVALVTVVDPATFAVAATDRWQAAYGLTPREIGLAQLLTSGHSIETAAENLAITAGTARVHLRNIFTKTATSRQSELILLLARLTG